VKGQRTAREKRLWGSYYSQLWKYECSEYGGSCKAGDWTRKQMGGWAQGKWLCGPLKHLWFENRRMTKKIFPPREGSVSVKPSRYSPGLYARLTETVYLRAVLKWLKGFCSRSGPH